MKTLLFILLSFIAVTATLSGLLMISKPDGGLINLSPSLLDGTPFKNFLVPGILLAVIVGGANLLAVVFNMQLHPNRYYWAMAGGIIISGWIVMQMILINAVYWLHFLYLVIGIIIILLAHRLKGKWAV